MGKENLFNYATKELSQDAFLRWLFESYKSENENVVKVVRHLLKEFAGIDENEEIKLHTLAQWNHIDVTVWVEIKNKENHVIAIEDKTLSGVGENQLTKYNNYLKGLVKKDGLEYIPHKVFYKTYMVIEDESEKVDAAGWEMYDLDRIVDLYSEFKQTGSEILDDYLEHIRNIRKCLNDASLPKTDNKSDDSYRWIGFFNEVKRRLEAEYGKKYDVSVGKTSYSYVCFVVRQKGKENEPYLECRSTQCTDNYFRALFLVFSDYWKTDKRDSFNAGVLKLIDNIDRMIKSKELKYFENNFRTSKKGNTPKQLVCTGEKTRSPQIEANEKRKHKAVNAEEFYNHLVNCLEEYDKIMEHWDFVPSKKII